MLRRWQSLRARPRIGHRWVRLHQLWHQCLWGSILVGLLLWGGFPAIAASPVAPSSPPTHSAPTAQNLDWQAIETQFSQALEISQAGSLPQAEAAWTQLIELLPDNPALWSNRGNVRVALGNLESAIADYNRAIALAPDQPDAYLNRGAVRENLHQWAQAINDYNQALALNPEDAAAYNNRGNAKAGLGEWDAAIADYQQAVTLNPNFALARANAALALYQTGDTEAAIRAFKTLIRKYPQFADMRAAISAALWQAGRYGEAESNWAAAMGLDSRYRDLAWVTQQRRWPPALVSALSHFLKLQPS